LTSDMDDMVVINERQPSPHQLAFGS